MRAPMGIKVKGSGFRKKVPEAFGLELEKILKQVGWWSRNRAVFADRNLLVSPILLNRYRS